MSIAGQGLQISSFVIAIAVASRLVIVSDYQIPTALGVASSSGPVSTLIGTILPLLGASFPIAMQLLAAATVLAVLAARFTLALSLLVATTLLFLATLFVSPAEVTRDEARNNISETTRNIIAVGDYTPAYLLFLLVLYLTYIRTRQGRRDARYLFERTFIVFAIGGTLIYILFSVACPAYPLRMQIVNYPISLQRVWLPAESIAMKDGSKYIGYVLSTDGEWTTILDDQPRMVYRVHSKEVESRTICRTDRGPDKLPLFPTVEEPAEIAPCPGYPK